MMSFGIEISFHSMYLKRAPPVISASAANTIVITVFPDQQSLKKAKLSRKSQSTSFIDKHGYLEPLEEQIAKGCRKYWVAGP